MKKTIFAITVASLLGGCAYLDKAGDFLKQIETGAYDAAAKGISEYCERADSPLAIQERIEARRELRQRGTDGPVGPFNWIEGLDEKTMTADGPVIRIYCRGEDVPDAVWKDLIR